MHKVIQTWLFRGKIISLYGPRQVGKTTLAKAILSENQCEKYYYDCEILHIRQLLETQNPAQYEKMFSKAKLIVLDEAQRVQNIGVILKLLHDHFPELQIIATGSSSFDLANKTNEPLTGRGLEFIMFPISVEELSKSYRYDQVLQKLNQLLVLGSYPEILHASLDDAPLLLQNLSSKYLYKDILELESIKKSDVLIKLLQLLALQIGNEVSLHEIAVNLQINPKTVANYIDLLEKSFVITRLKAFNRNLRKEISKKNKIYFIDLGIRNALLTQFNPLSLRTDSGALWENFCIIERLKHRMYHQNLAQAYFWRTHDGQEIDYLEEMNGKITAFEFKLTKPTKLKIPKAFIDAYPDTPLTCIHQNNFWEFLTGEPS